MASKGVLKSNSVRCFALRSLVLWGLLQLLFSTAAQALMCLDAFEQPLLQIPKYNEVPSHSSSKEMIDRVTFFAKQLIEKNYAAIRRTSLGGLHELAQMEIKFYSFMPSSTPYGTYLFQFIPRGTARYPDERYLIYVRSNGRVAFLDRTWKYRTRNDIAQRYSAIYQQEDGQIQIFDQGRALLESFPSVATLSRTMNVLEQEQWREGRPFSSKYGLKVHFFPNTTRFVPRLEPLLIELPRELLLEMYDRGQIEVNVYEDSAASEFRNRTVFGIDFEIVFVGEAAIQKLAPYIQSQLKVQDKYSPKK